jgi:hypothetical protein
MTRRPTSRDRCLAARVVLNWDNPCHWDEEFRPCRCCGAGTQGRDEHDRPCHKSCAESELAAELVGARGGGR